MFPADALLFPNEVVRAADAESVDVGANRILPFVIASSDSVIIFTLQKRQHSAKLSNGAMAQWHTWRENSQHYYSDPN